MNPTTLLPLARALREASLAAAFAEQLHAYADWQAYTGPEGGRGWRNTATGEIRYQDDEPDQDEPAAGGGVVAGLDKAARITAGVTAGGLLGSALGGPVGAVAGVTIGAALGTDTGHEILTGIRGLLNKGEQPEGAADQLADLSRRAHAGDPAATQTIRADTTAQMGHAAAQLVRQPPADAGLVRQGWSQAAGQMPPAAAAELGGHVEALASARDENGVRSALGGITSFLGKLTGGALRLAFGAIRSFARIAWERSIPYMVWAGALATGSAVLFSPAVALAAGLISWPTAFTLAPVATAGWFGSMLVGRRIQKTTGQYARPASERFADQRGGLPPTPADQLQLAAALRDAAAATRAQVAARDADPATRPSPAAVNRSAAPGKAVALDLAYADDLFSSGGAENSDYAAARQTVIEAVQAAATPDELRKKAATARLVSRAQQGLFARRSVLVADALGRLADVWDIEGGRLRGVIPPATTLQRLGQAVVLAAQLERARPVEEGQ